MNKALGRSPPYLQALPKGVDAVPWVLYSHPPPLFPPTSTTPSTTTTITGGKEEVGGGLTVRSFHTWQGRYMVEEGVLMKRKQQQPQLQLPEEEEGSWGGRSSGGGGGGSSFYPPITSYLPSEEKEARMLEETLGEEWEKVVASVLQVGRGSSTATWGDALYTFIPSFLALAFILAMLFSLYSVAAFGVLRGDAVSISLLTLWAVTLGAFVSVAAPLASASAIAYYLAILPHFAASLAAIPLIGFLSGAAEFMEGIGSGGGGAEVVVAVHPLTVVRGRLELVVGVYASAAASHTPLATAFMESTPLLTIAKALWNPALGAFVMGRATRGSGSRGGNGEEKVSAKRLARVVATLALMNVSLALATGYFPPPPFPPVAEEEEEEEKAMVVVAAAKALSIASPSTFTSTGVGSDPILLSAAIPPPPNASTTGTALDDPLFHTTSTATAIGGGERTSTSIQTDGLVEGGLGGSPPSYYYPPYAYAPPPQNLAPASPPPPPVLWALVGQVRRGLNLNEPSPAPLAAPNPPLSPRSGGYSNNMNNDNSIIPTFSALSPPPPAMATAMPPTNNRVGATPNDTLGAFVAAEDKKAAEAGGGGGGGSAASPSPKKGEGGWSPLGLLKLKLKKASPAKKG